MLQTQSLKTGLTLSLKCLFGVRVALGEGQTLEGEAEDRAYRGNQKLCKDRG